MKKIFIVLLFAFLITCNFDLITTLAKDDDGNGQLIGHAIPEHRYNSMNQGVRDFPLEPGSCDIEVYDYLWE